MNSMHKLETEDPPVTWGRMTMCGEVRASHAFRERPGTLLLLLRGQCLGDLVAEGGRALGVRMCGAAKGAPSGPWLNVDIHADSREAILAGWLNRLLYLARRDQWAPVECQVIALSDSDLRARVRGVPLGKKPRPWKAVIRTSSLGAPGERGLEAEVILETPREDFGPRAGPRRRLGARKSPK